MRKAVITIMAATLSVGPIGSALAIVSTNGGGSNGVQVNGGGNNGIKVNGGGENGRDAGGAVVIGIELPPPAAR